MFVMFVYVELHNDMTAGFPCHPAMAWNGLASELIEFNKAIAVVIEDRGEAFAPVVNVVNPLAHPGPKSTQKKCLGKKMEVGRKG